MYNGDIECDGYIFDIEHLEGASGDIISTIPLNLSTLQILFREEESKLVFSSVSLRVLNSDGVEFINEFLKKIEKNGTWEKLWKVSLGDRTGISTAPKAPVIK